MDSKIVNDSSDIILYLPWAPTVNSYYKHIGGSGRRGTGVYISKSGRAFRAEVEREVAEQIKSVDPGLLPLQYSIAMDVFLFPPDRRQRDLDNHMKALQDALTQCGFWMDDSQIDQLKIYRCEVFPKGQIIIRVGEAGPVLNEDWVKLIMRGDIEL